MDEDEQQPWSIIIDAGHELFISTTTSRYTNTQQKGNTILGPQFCDLWPTSIGHGLSMTKSKIGHGRIRGLCRAFLVVHVGSFGKFTRNIKVKNDEKETY